MNAAPSIAPAPPCSWLAMRHWAEAHRDNVTLPTTTREAAASLVQLLDVQRRIARTSPAAAAPLWQSCLMLAKKIAGA